MIAAADLIIMVYKIFMGSLLNIYAGSGTYAKYFYYVCDR